MKQTHIDWCPSVPVHWKECLFKNCVNICNGRDYKDIESSEGIPVIGSGGPFAYCTETMYDGEVIFLGRKGTIDKPLYFNGPFWAVDTMFYAIPQKGCFAKFLYYLATCFPFKKIFTQTALPSMTQTSLRNLRLFIPPIEEQQAIADYLDEKTTEIDKQVELLDQKQKAYLKLKASLINQVVTRGLNPYAPLRDSEIDWIGEIPAHWEVKRLKDITSLNPLCNISKCDSSVSFVPMESLRCGQIDLQEISFNEAKGKYTYFADDDLLVAKVTPCFENGNISLAKNLKEGIGFGSSEIFVLRCTDVLNTFMFYYSLSSQFRDNACATMCGVGGLKRISPLFMRTYQFAIPPIEEQQAIADYLDEKTAEIDNAITNIDKKIKAYKRLKQSLIDEVVTGKRKI